VSASASCGCLSCSERCATRRTPLDLPLSSSSAPTAEAPRASSLAPAAPPPRSSTLLSILHALTPSSNPSLRPPGPHAPARTFRSRPPRAPPPSSPSHEERACDSRGRPRRDPGRSERRLRARAGPRTRGRRGPSWPWRVERPFLERWREEGEGCGCGAGAERVQGATVGGLGGTGRGRGGGGGRGGGAGAKSPTSDASSTKCTRLAITALYPMQHESLRKRVLHASPTKRERKTSDEKLTFFAAQKGERANDRRAGFLGYRRGLRRERRRRERETAQ